MIVLTRQKASFFLCLMPSKTSLNSLNPEVPWHSNKVTRTKKHKEWAGKKKTLSSILEVFMRRPSIQIRWL
jgi:hypothetical protein